MIKSGSKKIKVKTKKKWKKMSEERNEKKIDE